MTAPAPHHTTPWRFVLLESAESRTRLLDAMRDAWIADLRRDGKSEESIAKQSGAVTSCGTHRIWSSPAS